VYPLRHIDDLYSNARELSTYIISDSLGSVFIGIAVYPVFRAHNQLIKMYSDGSYIPQNITEKEVVHKIIVHLH
jgi:hypothetical protein